MPLTRHRTNRPKKYHVQQTVKLVTVSVPEVIIHHTTGGYLRKAHEFVKKVYGQIVIRNLTEYEKLPFNLGTYRGVERRLKPLNSGHYNTRGDLTFAEAFKDRIRMAKAGRENVTKLRFLKY